MKRKPILRLCGQGTILKQANLENQVTCQRGIARLISSTLETRRKGRRPRNVWLLLIPNFGHMLNILQLIEVWMTHNKEISLPTSSNRMPHALSASLSTATLLNNRKQKLHKAGNSNLSEDSGTVRPCKQQKTAAGTSFQKTAQQKAAPDDNVEINMSLDLRHTEDG